jgi:hypothetical protein
VSAGGPVDGGTKAEAVRLHDDKVGPAATLGAPGDLHFGAADLQPPPFLTASCARLMGGDRRAVHCCAKPLALDPLLNLYDPARPTIDATAPPQTCYTGVYAKGGPTNVDMDPSSLASLCDRSPADARGVKVCSCMFEGAGKAGRQGPGPPPLAQAKMKH